MIYFSPRYKQCDQDVNSIQKVASIINATLFFWVSRSGRSNYLSDSKDVVVFAEVGEGNVVKLGEGEEMNNDQYEHKRSILCTTGYSLLSNSEDVNDQKERKTTNGLS